MHSQHPLQPRVGQGKGLDSRRTISWTLHETNAWNFWHFPGLPNEVCAILCTTFMTQRSPHHRPDLYNRRCCTDEVKTPSSITKENSKWLGRGTQQNAAVLLRIRDSSPSLLVTQLTFLWVSEEPQERQFKSHLTPDLKYLYSSSEFRFNCYEWRKTRSCRDHSTYVTRRCVRRCFSVPPDYRQSPGLPV